MKLKLGDRDTLHLKVAKVIREAILRGDYHDGDRLVQEEIANQLGVSRMPVREALRKIESEGLIVIEPHRGAIVKSITAEDVEEIYELRSELEKKAVLLSVEKFSREDVENLEYCVHKMSKTTEVDEFILANIEFHRLLVSRCPYKRLLSFIDTLWNGFPQYTPHMITGQVNESNEEHKRIVEAVKVRDSVKASEMVADHIRRTGKRLVENLK